MDSLEAYLLAQSDEAVLDSSGTFTMDRLKALEKLAQFQLPGEHHWALKVVQAVVASGASQLKILRGILGIQFVFDGGWPLEQVEAGFFNPEVGPDRSLEHLKAALWSVGYAGMRPFQYIPARSSRSLIWNGSNLEVVSCKESPEAQLQVSQSTLQNLKRLPLEGMEAIRALEALAALLTEKAFFCPIPLSLEEKRIDGVRRGIPLESCHSIAFLCGSGDFPRLALPPGAEAGLPEDRQFGCCAAILGHLSNLDEMASRLFWVRDGVVVDTELLPFSGSVSAHIFISAEGLESDLTGFSVRGGEDRVARVFACLASSVAGLKVNYDEPEGNSFGWVNHLGKAVMAGSVLFLGAGTVFASPLTLLMGGVVGVAGYRLRQFQPPTLESVSDSLERGLQQLKTAWSSQLGRLDQTRAPAVRSRRRRQG